MCCQEKWRDKFPQAEALKEKEIKTEKKKKNKKKRPSFQRGGKDGGLGEMDFWSSGSPFHVEEEIRSLARMVATARTPPTLPPLGSRAEQRGRQRRGASQKAAAPPPVLVSRALARTRQLALWSLFVIVGLGTCIWRRARAPEWSVNNGYSVAKVEPASPSPLSTDRPQRQERATHACQVAHGTRFSGTSLFLGLPDKTRASLPRTARLSRFARPR